MSKRLTLLETYHALREAGTVSDFPNLLGNVAYKRLLKGFRGVQTRWMDYVLQTDVVDFKSNDRIILGEAPDLLEVPEHAPFQDGAMPGDKKYQIAATTKGRTWQLTRQAIINDDLNGFMTFAEKYGRAANRTIGKQCVSMIESNGLAYDGVALFAAAHANTVAGDLTADDAGVAKIDSALAKFRNQTDPDSGEKISIEPYALLVPPSKETTAMRLVGPGELRPISTSGGPVFNPWQGRFKVIVEPLLTITNRCYLIANPADMHVVEVAFLNGKREPDLLLKRAESIRLMGGGEDPYGYEMDDMEWKVRHDWGTSLAYYQGIVAIGGGIT